MAYPTSSTTYKLPFDTKVRVSSARRFILVRENNEGKAFIVRRSDTEANLTREFRRDSDYIIDQVKGLVTYYFNGRREIFDGIDGKHLAAAPAPFVNGGRGA